jgi:colicin import membrane protein
MTMAILAKVVRKINDGASLNRMVLLSLILHALVLSVLFLSPSFPTRKWTFGPVYTVDLVSLPSGYLEKAASTTLTREVAAISSRAHATAMKKTYDAPIQRLAPVRKESSRDEVEKAIDRVRKKVAASSSSQATAARQGVVETNQAVHAYYEAIWSRIKAEWALPRGILPSKNLEAIVDVTVSRSGSVASLSIERSSGNRYFDQSALRAIRKASPFPPIPDSIRGSSIDLGIRFHTAQFR